MHGGVSSRIHIRRGTCICTHFSIRVNVHSESWFSSYRCGQDNHGLNTHSEISSLGTFNEKRTNISLSLRGHLQHCTCTLYHHILFRQPTLVWVPVLGILYIGTEKHNISNASEKSSFYTGQSHLANSVHATA